MRLLVLGSLVVAGPSGLQPVRGRRPADLLALLAQRRGAPVAADVLLDRVWGEAATGITPGTVHTVVARLRRTMGAEGIRSEPGGYRLGQVELDADDFEAGCTRARRAAAAGEWAAAGDSFRAALALWRSDVAYAGVSDDLVEAERARLAEARARATESLCRLLLGLVDDPSGRAASDPPLPEVGPDHAAEALMLAAELVQRHPLRETPAGLLALAAYRCGRPADALETLAALRSRLRGELGVDPSRPISELQQQILAADPRLDAPRPRGPVRAGSPRRRGGVARRPPVPMTETIGRDAEIASVLGALAEGRRLVTLVGPGGVGKSRLLAEVAARLGEDAAGVPPLLGYLDLAGLGRLAEAELAEAAAVALGVGGDAGDPVASLVQALVAARGVLLVDEAEWLPETVGDLLGRLIAHCRGVQAVVTSRVPLAVAGERLVVLSPLACAPARSFGVDVLGAPAVRLLAARMTDAGHPPEPADAETLGRIARRVDGLPLALEIVAGHAAAYRPEDLLDLLETPLDVEALQRGVPERHRSLRDTLSWSVQRLTEPQVRVLARLAVFAGPIDPAAAVVVCADGHAASAVVDSWLRALVREGLVGVQRSAPRLQFRLLRTVRDLAGELLDELGERRECERRLRRWYAARWLGQPRSDALIEDVLLHYDDYLAALAGAIETDPEAAAEIVVTLSRFWLFGSLRAIGHRWTARVLAGAELDELRAARVRLCQAMLNKTDPVESQVDVLRALPVLQRWGERADLVSAHMVIALHETHGGHSEEATVAARQAVEVAREVGLERLCDALGVLAVVRSDARDHDETLAVVDEALAALGSARSTVAQVAVTSNLAHALINVGLPRRALALVDEVLPVAGHLAGSGSVDFLIETSGWAALGAGQPQRALRHFGDVVAALGAQVGRSQYGISASIGAAAALAEVGAAEAPVAARLARRWFAGSGFAPPPYIAVALAVLDEVVAADPGAEEPPALDADGWLLGAIEAAVSRPD